MKGVATGVLALFLLVSFQAGAESFGAPKRIPRPDEYGRVVMDNFSSAAGVAAVRFDHWLHRAEYTCRVCHVDLGFAMRSGGTRVREADNQQHLYCGACHDGGEAFGPLQDTAGHKRKACKRCHAVGTGAKPNPAFHAFTAGFPRTPYGNHIDWLKADRQGLIHLKDSIPGVTRRRRPIRYKGDVVIIARNIEMPEIVFSHPKHAVWSGCEVCHPAIFGVKHSASHMSMQAIFEGRYCGACHGKVSFPLDFDCRLCHTKDMF